MLADSHDLLSTLERKVLPAHAALLVVDVQNDFVADGGFFDQIGADVKTIQKAIPPLVQLIDRAREAGVFGQLVDAQLKIHCRRQLLLRHFDDFHTQ